MWSNDISDVAIRARSRRTPTRRPPGRRPRSPGDGRSGLPAGASDIDKSDFAIGTRRERARNARSYEGSLTKRGGGTLFLTGNDAWHGDSTVRGGKLSVVGSHASSIDVAGGTLGGSGTVQRSIDVDGGVLQPGLAPRRPSGSSTCPSSPATSCDAGGDVDIDRRGRVEVTIRSDDDYTSVRAAGELELDGGLALDVDGALSRGTVLTIMRGRSISGRFQACPKSASCVRAATCSGSPTRTTG